MGLGPGAVGQGPGLVAIVVVEAEGQGPRYQWPRATGQGPRAKSRGGEMFGIKSLIVFEILFLDRVCDRDGVVF